MKHDNNFNFLRFWLAWVVILSHSFELIDGDRSRELLTQVFGTYSFGEFAVNAFFLMSGYFISQSWVSAPRFGDFMKKRLLRLTPAFVLAVLLSVLLIGPLASEHYWQNFSHARFWPGLLVFRFDSPYSFDGWPYPMVNGPLWTLHYEYVCYWLVAALGLMGWIGKRSVVLPMFALCLLAYMAVIYLQAQSFRPDTPAGFWTWVLGGRYIRLFTFFLAGVVWFHYRERIPLSGPLALTVALIGAALFFDPYGAAVAMTLPLALLMHYAGYRSMPALRGFQAVDLSYGMYLYAWPVQKLLLYYGATRDPWVLTLLTTAVVVPAAWLSWHAIEKPFLKLKPRPLAKPAAEPPQSIHDGAAAAKTIGNVR